MTTIYRLYCFNCGLKTSVLSFFQKNRQDFIKHLKKFNAMTRNYNETGIKIKLINTIDTVLYTFIYNVYRNIYNIVLNLNKQLL